MRRLTDYFRNLAIRALDLARERGKPHMVCDMDHEDTRRFSVQPLCYADEPEFEAFDGEVVLVAHPDGTTE